MEIRNLVTFTHVAELGSFTKAAELLGYSQSTVSFQIKQLEEELECLLFERINHTLILTQKGRELLAYAHQVRHLTDAFHQSFHKAEAITGFIHVLTPDSVCEAMLMDNYQDFYRCYPGIRLKFSTADTEDMFRLLDRNEADIMLTLDGHVYQRDYVIAKEKRMPAHFVVGKNSPLAPMQSLSVQDLLSQPVILTEKGMGYRRVLDDALARRSIQLEPVLEISRPDLITRLLEQGDAVSFLPDFITQGAVEAGRLVRLHVTDVKVDIWQQLIYHRNKWISNCLKAFIDYVQEKEFGR
ncbi:MAG: LysR family transcriptional regulator [Clostridia bacterium]|nr:LysR family transcriptional regulator [Clostridia bacterium]